MKQACTLLLILFGALWSYGQDTSKVRLSGIILEFDSIKPIPYTNLRINHTNSGAIADQMGLFSLEAYRGDTLYITSIGMKSSIYVIPDSLEQSSYSIILKMIRDTVNLNTLEVNSWPSLEQFNRAFTEKKGFDKEYSIADRNASPMLDKIDYSREIEMKEYVEMNGRSFNNVYLNAHIPLNDVLNPKRWDKLVTYWKTGQHR